MMRNSGLYSHPNLGDLASARVYLWNLWVQCCVSAAPEAGALSTELRGPALRSTSATGRAPVSYTARERWRYWIASAT
jgi:hypothetical protein